MGFYLFSRKSLILKKMPSRQQKRQKKITVGLGSTGI
jgi:hypothetical protein